MYKAITYTRNKLYDLNILKATSFKVPIISLGNLSVGGTGKTPHIEYLIRLLKNKKIYTLSRGYKRKTHGFIIANSQSTSSEIGDEPLQFYKKFKDIKVAVCEKRTEGVKKILDKEHDTDIILLDDAFQHRRITPGLQILITDFDNLFYHDYLLPSGRLRESRSGYKRAQIIIVSKTPFNATKEELNNIKKQIKPTNIQKVFFTGISYTDTIPFTTSAKEINQKIDTKTRVLLATGIGNSKPLKSFLEQNYNSIVELKFPDHHNYTKTDIEKIKNEFKGINGNNKIIITTEKDIMRLSLPENFKNIQDLPIFFIPINVEFLDEESKNNFDQQILDYVNSN